MMNIPSWNLPLLQAAQGNGTGQLITTFVTFGLVFVIFYFLIIRPQNKKQKETKDMLNRVKKGDRVQTIGGLRATVHSVGDQTLILKVDDNTKIEFVKSAIANVIVDKPEKGDKPDKSDKQETQTPPENKA
jgi:preprotein translocase subunit YajC